MMLGYGENDRPTVGTVLFDRWISFLFAHNSYTVNYGQYQCILHTGSKKMETCFFRRIALRSCIESQDGVRKGGTNRRVTHGKDGTW